MKKRTRCWNCGARHTAVTGLGESQGLTPDNGDVTLCIRCGEWNVFDAACKAGMRQPTDAEFIDIGENPHCRAVRWAWVESGKRRG